MNYSLSGLCRTVRRHAANGPVPFSRRVAVCLFSSLMALAMLFVSAQIAMAQKGTSISFLADEGAKLTIEDAASLAKMRDYQVYVPSFMAFSRLPETFNGAIWLRIVIGPSFEKPVGPLRVNFGSALPGTARLYVPKKGSGFAMMESLPSEGTFTLPEGAPFPEILYARIDGVPGLWFRPVLEAAPDTVNDIPVRMILAGAFALAMLLMLVQYIRRAEEWRLWAALAAGFGAVAALIPPIPPAGAAFEPLSVLGMVLPGIILLFFVHAARHLFSSPKTLAGYDKLLAFYYIIAAALSLLPLVPGFLWTARYLPLWALAIVPLLPVAMVALGRSLRGSMWFFLAVLLPIAGVAASAWELTSTSAPLLGGSGALWGAAFGMLFLSFTGPVKPANDEKAEEDVFDSLDRTCPPPLSLGIEPESTGATTDESGELPLPSLTFTDESVAQTPTLPDDEYPELSLFEDAPAPSTEPVPVAETLAVTNPEPPFTAAVEPPAFAPPAPAPAVALDAPFVEKIVEKIMAAEQAAAAAEAAVATEAAPVPEAAPATTATPVTVAATVAEPPVITDESPLDSTVVDEIAPVHPMAFMPETPLGHGRKSLFDLPLLVREAYDGPAQIAERKNVGMSWFIAPQTGRLFEGEADLLDSALRLLLRDMVEGIDRGNVRLNVRRLPEGDAGHIVFTIVETDTRQTSHARNMAGLAEAWSLAEKTGGIFSVEHSPGGTTVIFSAVLAAMDKPAAESPVPAFETPPGAHGVHVFSDHPDMAAPEELEIIAAPPLQGLEAGDFAEHSDTERDPSRIIVADTAASSRARTARAFIGSPYAVLECTSPPAAYTLYTRHPSALVIMNADMPEIDIAAAVADIHADDERNGRAPAPFLVLVDHAQQASRMMAAGVSRTLLKPAATEDIVRMANELAPTGSATPVPAEPPRAESPALPVPETVAPPFTAPVTNEKPEGLPIPAAAITPLGAAPNAPEEAPVKAEPAPVAVETATAFEEKPAATPTPEAAAYEAPVPPAATPEPEVVLNNALNDIPLAGQHDTAPEKALGQVEKPAEEKTGGIFDSILPEATPEADVAPAEKAVQKQESAKPEAKKQDRPALGLLDMIITDEGATIEDEHAEKTPSAPAPKKKVSVTVSSKRKKGEAAPENAPEIPEKQAEPASPKGGKVSRLHATQSVTSQPPQRDPIHDEYSLYDEPILPGGQTSVPLPGEDDGVYKDMVPLIPGLIHELSDAMLDAAQGREENNAMLIENAASRVAAKADAFGLVKLERMARCVERAAAANDMEPATCILADLENWIERYKESLVKLHRSMQW